MNPTCICLFDFNPNPNLRDSISFAYHLRNTSRGGNEIRTEEQEGGTQFFLCAKNHGEQKIENCC